MALISCIHEVYRPSISVVTTFFSFLFCVYVYFKVQRLMYQ